MLVLFSHLQEQDWVNWTKILKKNSFKGTSAGIKASSFKWNKKPEALETEYSYSMFAQWELMAGPDSITEAELC